MKIHLAYDHQGRILAAVLQPGSNSAPRVRFAAQPGATVGDFDLPPELEEKRLAEFLHFLSVNDTEKRLVVAPRRQAPSP
jgi:hypothetical protein